MKIYNIKEMEQSEGRLPYFLDLKDRTIELFCCQHVIFCKTREEISRGNSEIIRAACRYFNYKVQLYY